MHCIKFKTDVSYKDVDGSFCVSTNFVCAETATTAKLIARELFFAEYGVASSMSVAVAPVIPSSEELNKVNRALVVDFPAIRNMFSEIDYKKFLQLYVELEGWDFQSKDSCLTYMFKFRNYVCKAKFDHAVSGISMGEVLYFGDRLYVLRNNLSEVYLGGVF